MAEYLFNWLPVRDVIAILLFSAAFITLFLSERTRKTGKLHYLILGTLLWTLGMIFDALRRVEGWGALRIIEHLFQLSGSVFVVYSAYQTSQRVKSTEGDAHHGV